MEFGEYGSTKDKSNSIYIYIYIYIATRQFLEEKYYELLEKLERKRSSSNSPARKTEDGSHSSGSELILTKLNSKLSASIATNESMSNEQRSHSPQKHPPNACDTQYSKFNYIYKKITIPVYSTNKGNSSLYSSSLALKKSLIGTDSLSLEKKKKK